MVYHLLHFISYVINSNEEWLRVSHTSCFIYVVQLHLNLYGAQNDVQKCVIGFAIGLFEHVSFLSCNLCKKAMRSLVVFDYVYPFT